MLNFGWKSKVDKLKMFILAGGHQTAKELEPSLGNVLELYRRAATTGDIATLEAEMAAAASTIVDADRPLFEPATIGSWKLQVGFYRKDGALWWLFHATLPTNRVPHDKEVGLLHKIVERMEGLPDRHVIIGPKTVPEGEPMLPFGWWTWKNLSPLFEVQVNKAKKGMAAIRVVPLGSRETDGYVSINNELAKRE